MKVLTLILINSLFAVALFSQPGTLDESFGMGGKVTTDISGSYDFLNTMAIQADGKILVGGSSSYSDDFGNEGDSLVIARYLTNGVIDTSFGEDGFIIISLGSGYSFGAVQRILIQPDGKILIAGSWSSNIYAVYLILSRYNSNGIPDESFGTAGMIKISFASVAAKSIALQQDGKIVVGSFVTSTLYVLRFSSTGILDSSFGNNGKTTPFFIGSSDGCDVTIQADGKIVAAHTHYADVGLVRYNSNGSFDSTFGIDGRSVIDMWGFDDRANSIIQQPDQKIIVTGVFGSPSQTNNFCVARFKSNGSLDSSFGDNGKALASTGIAYAGTLQPDGKIIAAGEINNNFGLARFKSTGMLDSSFGIHGVVVTPFGTISNRAYGVLLQPDGKIVAGGINYSENSATDFALARYSNNTSFPITNIQPGLWSNPANWSNNRVPDETSIIQLDFDVTVDMNAQCKSLTTKNHVVTVNQNIRFHISGHSE